MGSCRFTYHRGVTGSGQRLSFNLAVILTMQPQSEHVYPPISLGQSLQCCSLVS